MPTGNPLSEYRLHDDAVVNLARRAIKVVRTMVTRRFTAIIFADEKLRTAYFAASRKEQQAVHLRIVKNIFYHAFTRLEDMEKRLESETE